MITIKQLNPHNLPTTAEIDNNLMILQERINFLESQYGKPFTITSGLRSETQQQSLIRAGKSRATKSKHLVGAAVDIADPNGSLYDWCKAHGDVLEQAQLYCEERQGGWQHFQIFPPVSGKRWFLP